MIPPTAKIRILDTPGTPVLKDFPQVTTWVTGGHSLGGVAAAYFAYTHHEVKGIVFWASYPADDRLRNSAIKMLSIYGTEDGGLDHGAKIEQYKAFEPADTEFVVIQGANHASLVIMVHSLVIIRLPFRLKANGNRPRTSRFDSLHHLHHSKPCGVITRWNLRWISPSSHGSLMIHRTKSKRQRKMKLCDFKKFAGNSFEQKGNLQ